MSKTLPQDSSLDNSLIPSALNGEALSRRVRQIAKETHKPRSSESTSGVSKSLTGIQVVGTGIATGSRKLDNNDLSQLGCDSEWIVQRTGIQSRYHTTDDEAVSDLCLRAARQCLAGANVDPDEIDLIVVGTMTPDHASPSTACIVQAELGCRAMAMDLNAACSGFVYSLVTASQFVATKSVKCALVIGADMISMVTDPKDLKTFPLFGDGAGAALVKADCGAGGSQPSGILDFHLRSEGALGHTLLIPAGGSRMPFCQEALDNRLQYLKMDGKPVFKWAVKVLPEAIIGALARTGLTLDDIDLVIPHQANIRIIDAAIEAIGIDREKVLTNVDRYGNTSAASIPIALHEAVTQKRIKRGSNVLLVGFGAGLNWGSCLLRW